MRYTLQVADIASVCALLVLYRLLKDVRAMSKG